MRNISLLLPALILFTTCLGQTKPPSADVQIKTALLAAPAAKRDSATVYGYSESNELVVLKKGTNEIICVADDPSQADGK